jgi:hypothetical protein
VDVNDLAVLIQTGVKDLADRIDRIEGRFEQVDVRFGQMDVRFAQSDIRFDRLEQELRQVNVQIEGLRGDIRQVAEGVYNVEEKLDRHTLDNQRDFDELRVVLRMSTGFPGA